MDLDKVYVFDIETDGLLPQLSKLHVLSAAWKDAAGNVQVKSTNNPKDIEKLFSDPNNTLVGHNIICYDIPAINKLFPHIIIRANLIDTLSISWYLYEERLKHGLESWGEDFAKVSENNERKVKIDDWENLSYDQYVERCEGDIRINFNLWDKFLIELRELYDDPIRPIKYLNHKLNCLRIQEANPIRIDVPRVRENLAKLDKIITEKEDELRTVMPKIPIKKIVNFPSKGLYKQGGSLSVSGQKYLEYCQGAGLGLDYTGPIEVVTGYLEPNPQSTQQIKEFLLSRGWIPEIFKDGANGPVPQLRDDDKNLCSSILKLIEQVPELKSLDGLSVAQHRRGYLKAFLEMVNEDGYIYASAGGFAASLRLRHRKPFVNLPKVTAAYGDLVRSCIIAPENQVLIGADISSLEDKTKQMAIYSYDQEYVEQMNFPGFDAHLDIGTRAELMTEKEAGFYRWYKKKEGNPPVGYENKSPEELSDIFNEISVKRSISKTCNYALTYNCGVLKLAKSAGVSEKKARVIHKAYWDRNWSLKKYAEDRITKKTSDGRDWVFNPYSNLWLRSRSSHTKFSVCNQNTGAKIFDLWLYFAIEAGLNPVYQAHDEMLIYVNKNEVENTQKILRESMQKVNDLYNHPIKIEIDVQSGERYSEVH